MLKTRPLLLILLSLQVPALMGALFYVLTFNPFIHSEISFTPQIRGIAKIDSTVTSVAHGLVMESLSKRVLVPQIRKVEKVASVEVPTFKKFKPKKATPNEIKAEAVEIKALLPQVKSTPKAVAIKASTKDEIPDDSEFQQYGFEAEVEELKLISWSNYLNSQNVAGTLAALNEATAQRQLAAVETVEVIEQEVSTAQSSVIADEVNFANDEEAQALNILLAEKSNQAPDDDLVLIDYSKESELGDSTLEIKMAENTLGDEKVVTHPPAVEAFDQFGLLEQEISDQSVAEVGGHPQVSDTVMAAISRSRDQLLAEVDPSLLTSQLASQSRGPGPEKQSYNFSGDEITKERGSARGASFLETREHRLVIQALVGRKGQELTQKVYNYEFIPSFNPTLSLYDNADGEIVVNGELKSSTALLSGSLVKAGFVRTRIEVPVERGYVGQPIPFLEQEALLNIIDEKGLRGGGGHLLVELTEQVDDIEIDAGHEAKLYLNGELNFVSEALEASFVIFIGIEPGNMTITYLHGNRSTTKVIGVYEDELFVDTPVLMKQNPFQLRLVERNLMGKNATDLLIEGAQMKSFSSGKESIPLAYNNYEIDHEIKPIGMRNYVELTNTGAFVMGGHGEREFMEIPSRDFMENILRIFSLSDLNRSCLVQVNFADKIESVELNAEGARGTIDHDTLYLDQDGIFNAEASELATKLFLSGHEQGLFYVNVNYQDGSKDMFKTFCSLGTYLFEQL